MFSKILVISVILSLYLPQHKTRNIQAKVDYFEAISGNPLIANSDGTPSDRPTVVHDDHRRHYKRQIGFGAYPTVINRYEQDIVYPGGGMTGMGGGMMPGMGMNMGMPIRGLGFGAGVNLWGR
jgi:hypothetical protein